SDYMSSAGIRHPNARPAPTGSVPIRRPGDESPGGQGPEAPRREPSSDPRRPLPTVAPSAPAPPVRRPTAPRPGGGSPEVKTQRPEKRYTPDELMAMMRSGQLGAQAPGAAPPRPGGPAPRPGMGPRPTT